MNRREFIEQSTVFTLAGMALPFPEFRSEEAVRIAVVGTGGRGTDLIRTLSTIEHAHIVGICDDYPPHLQKAHEVTGPEAKAFTSYSEMLTQTRPSAVVIATPLYLHYDMCMEALQAGCAVFCEKTMCYSIDQANSLAKTVHQQQAIFQVGLQRRANPIYRQARAMISSGMLGQIIAIKCQWHRNNDWRRPVPISKSDSQWKKLEHRLNWRLYLPYSRGLMTELASHQMDVVNWMLDATPTQVLGSGNTDYWKDGREVYDNIFCIYDYQLTNQEGNPYSVRATYSSIQANAYEGASELIMGTKGSLYLTTKKGLFYTEAAATEIEWAKEDKELQQAEIITAGKTLKLSNDPWAHRSKPFEIDADSDDTRDELIAFLDCVQRQDPNTICDVDEGLKDTITVLNGHKALHEKKVVIFT